MALLETWNLIPIRLCPQCQHWYVSLNMVITAYTTECCFLRLEPGGWSYLHDEIMGYPTRGCEYGVLTFNLQEWVDDTTMRLLKTIPEGHYESLRYGS